MWLRKSWQVWLLVVHFLGGMLKFLLNEGHRRPRHPDTRELIRRWYQRMLHLLQVEVTVLGDIVHEHERPVVYIANHISWLDVPLIGSLTPVNFLSKAEVADWPVVGRLARVIGTLFIARGSGDTDHVMQAIKSHLEQRHSVLIFPEGTTTDGSKVRRFHKKLFKVCELTEVEVHPLLIHYRSVAAPNPVPFVGDISIGTHFWQLLGNGKIYATVESLPPIKLDPDQVGQQLREVELIMREKLSKVNS